MTAILPPASGVGSASAESVPGARPSRLLVRFAILSVASIAVILLVVGTGFGYIFRWQVVDRAKVDAMAVAEAIFRQESDLLLQPGPDGWPRLAVAPADFPALDLRMRRYLSTFGMVKVKLYDAQRKIIYSTDQSIIGLVDSGNARLERLLRTGEVDSEVVSKGRIADLYGQELFSVDVVETYVPVRLESEVVGSFEVYVDVTPGYARVRRTVGIFVAGLLAILVVVFTVLYLLMRQGTRSLSRVQAKLNRLASTDVLTGLLNRRELLSRIALEFSRLEARGGRRKSNDPVCLVMADIDHFKKINDTHGHLAGDAVLREVAARLAGALRNYDAIGRYGGEEFLAMLPHTEAEGARVVAERMRKSLEYAPIDVGGSPVRVTGSFGVAECADAEGSMEKAIERADQALYRAKEGGRNRVEVSA